MGLVIVPLASLGMGLTPSLQLSAVGLTAPGLSVWGPGATLPAGSGWAGWGQRHGTQGSRSLNP